jgi:hypothetical protein
MEPEFYQECAAPRNYQNFSLHRERLCSRCQWHSQYPLICADFRLLSGVDVGFARLANYPLTNSREKHRYPLLMGKVLI